MIRSLLAGLVDFLVRVSSFLTKEMVEILRQPRLVATLILGPFLILLIFGVGYNNSPRVMRTVMVIPDDSKIGDEIRDIAGRLGGAVELVGFVSTTSEGTEMLEDGEADLVMVTPPDPYGDILANRQAEMDVIHQEIDPLEKIFVETLERAYLEEVNRLITIRVLDQAKASLDGVQGNIEQASTTSARLEQNLRQGNGVAAVGDAAELARDFQQIQASLNASLSTAEGVRSLENKGQTDSPMAGLEQAQELVQKLEDLDPNKESYDQEAQYAAEIQQDLATTSDLINQFNDVDSNILARPFKGQAIQFSNVTFGPIDFYVPGVIALLLQHIAITLAALSFVRERVGGAIELFRAAPIGAFETLLGKTISFMIMGAILAAVLSALVILGLNVPMLGTWQGYVVIIMALLYASLAMGFAISSISQTDSQAVQYAMIVLLASIFFSGFFIALHSLLPAVHIVSWLIPATYGTAMLQDLMLRGYPVNPLLLLGLILYGLLLFLFSWWRLRRLMARI